MRIVINAFVGEYFGFPTLAIDPKKSTFVHVGAHIGERSRIGKRTLAARHQTLLGHTRVLGPGQLVARRLYLPIHPLGPPNEIHPGLDELHLVRSTGILSRIP